MLARRPRPVHRRPGRDPLRQDDAARRSAPTRPGRACPPARSAPGPTSASSASARCWPPPPRPPTGSAERRHRGHRLGPAGGQAARSRDARRRRRPPPRGHHRGRPARRRRRRRRSPTRCPSWHRSGGPAVRVLGVPSVYLAQGKPDVILARLGLDADGIVDEVLAPGSARRATSRVDRPDRVGRARPLRLSCRRGSPRRRGRWRRSPRAPRGCASMIDVRMPSRSVAALGGSSPGSHRPWSRRRCCPRRRRRAVAKPPWVASIGLT